VATSISFINQDSTLPLGDIEMSDDAGDKKSTVVQVNSSLKGMLGKLSSNATWTAAAAYACARMYNAFDAILSKYGTDTYSRFFQSQAPHDEQCIALALGVGVAATGLAAVVGTANFFNNLLYKSRRKVEIDVTNRRITSTDYTFPFYVKRTEMNYDRVSTMSTRQGPLDLMLDTGTVVFETLQDQYGANHSQTHVLMGIERPNNAQEGIMEKILPYARFGAPSHKTEKQGPKTS